MSRKTLTKAEIVDAIHDKTGLTCAKGKVILDSLLSIMKKAIKKDLSLLLSGFGRFEAYDKKPRKGRNPQTDEALILPARKVLVFRLSRKFRAEINPGE